MTRVTKSVTRLQLWRIFTPVSKFTYCTLIVTNDQLKWKINFQIETFSREYQMPHFFKAWKVNSGKNGWGRSHPLSLIHCDHHGSILQWISLAVPVFSTYCSHYVLHIPLLPLIQCMDTDTLWYMYIHVLLLDSHLWSKSSLYFRERWDIAFIIAVVI